MTALMRAFLVTLRRRVGGNRTDERANFEA
jgi:hypothetical protein